MRSQIPLEKHRVVPLAREHRDVAVGIPVSIFPDAGGVVETAADLALDDGQLEGAAIVGGDFFFGRAEDDLHRRFDGAYLFFGKDQAVRVTVIGRHDARKDAVGEIDDRLGTAEIVLHGEFPSSGGV